MEVNQAKRIVGILFIKFLFIAFCSRSSSVGSSLLNSKIFYKLEFVLYFVLAPPLMTHSYYKINLNERGKGGMF